jgi:hypothetical protein
VTYTFNFSEAVTGFDASDVTLSVGSKGAFTAMSTSQYTLVVTPPSGTGSMTLDVAGGAAVDTAGNASTVAAQNTQAYSISPAGAATIGLGTDENGDSYGQLMSPIQVEGLWYYYWDRSSDGFYGSSDKTTHDILNGIFNENSSGEVETDSNKVGSVGSTDNTFRYATINGVHLALPVYGDTVDGNGVRQGSTVSHSGTSVSGNTTTDNPTYDGMLAIWDSENGTSTDSGTEGVPGEWAYNRYWSATPSVTGHAVVDLRTGNVLDGGDTLDLYVALQVL